MNRKWNVYEQNQLIRYGLWGEDVSMYSEMPVEYITGHAEFDGSDFLVNRDVLIPRVETVQIVDVAEKLLADKIGVDFAEIGTGSGAIGIALFRRLKNKKVTATLSDISQGALMIAAKNLSRLIGETNKVKLVESDLLDNIDPAIKFDLIIANLPYIPTSRVPLLPESVVGYEPQVALDGGPEGLTLIKKLLVQAKNRLQKDGALILEIDYSHDIPDFVDIREYQYEIVKDEFGQNRFLVARKSECRQRRCGRGRFPWRGASEPKR
ncbi:MAG: HemK/PrmC family methyltransferase [Patescibacteria group bacterium]